MGNQLNKGFTLVELSIVLVIVGLIVGGVVAGKSLIKAGELRRIVSDVQGLKTAINAFKLQYDNYLPGDIPNATDYWPACPNHSGSDSCNGDGDGLVEIAGSHRRITNTDPVNESDRANQHLSLAGLIPGEYSGTRYAGTGVHQIDAGFRDAKYSIVATANDGTYVVFTKRGNLIALGTNDSGNTWGSILNAEEAHSIDLKIDDGIATDGDVYGRIGNPYPGNNNCLSISGQTGTYILSDPNRHCIILFWIEKY